MSQTAETSPRIEITVDPVEDDDDIQQQPAHNPRVSTVKRVQRELIQSHPFGIKIWKPALYKKHRSIDQQTYDDLHKVPGSLPIDISVGNLLWVLLFGWWIALVYLIVIGLFLAPAYMFGILGRAIFSRDYGRRTTSSITKFFENLSTLWDYIYVLYNLTGYIFWPFGKFMAKKLNTVVDSSDMLPAEVPLMSSNEYEVDIHDCGLLEPIEPPAIIPRKSVEGRDEWDSESDNEGNETGTVSIHHRNLFSKALKSGPAGFYFFLVVLLVLGPIHLITSALMFFLVLPIPMSKLNYYLLRHILRHPLTLSAYWAVADEDMRIPSELAPSARPRMGGSLGTGGLRPINPNSGRPKSIFFWRTESAAAYSETEETLPTIMVTPSLRPTANRNEVVHGPDYMIVLCTYRAMGKEYARYTVDGINIIFINLISAIVFTLFNFYLLGPLNGYTGISSKPIIFITGLLSTVPLSYFIGMAVSAITAQTGSVAVGAVVNATFGSIIEILLYAFGLMNGKEDMVQGAIIGSFLLGLLALPGAAMFSGGLNRIEQRFNSKSASVTSTMLVVAVICVFTPTIYQNIHGTYQFECKLCPNDSLILSPSSCRNCIIKQPHPTEDQIYLTSTRPLMYICAFALVLTYAIGLLFTLRTHNHKIYGPPKKSKRKNTSKSAESERKTPAQSSQAAFKPKVDEAEESTSSVPVKRRKKTTLSKERPISIVSTPDDASSVTSIASEANESGHDNPGWGLFKSAIVLLGCTVAYSMIAEILIDAIDEIIEVFPIGEKTLGLTLFAIVPTVTEFYNAISFAASGNIVLALEIGSAYAIQVAMVQIPALVAFSAWLNYSSSFGDVTPLLKEQLSRSEFTMDEITTIFVVGFPDDMAEREFQNMFTFCCGFEAAALKIPNIDSDESGSTKKQIIGFAKFRSVEEAMQARDVLSGRKIDSDRGCVLKAEMAKKNLHTKRGTNSEVAKLYASSSFRRRSSAPDPIGIDQSYYKGSDYAQSFESSSFSTDFYPHQNFSTYETNPNADVFDPFAPSNPVFETEVMNSAGSSEQFYPSDLAPSAEEYDAKLPPLFGSSQSSRGFSSILYNSDALLSKSMASVSVSDDAYRSNTFSPALHPGADQNPPCNTLYVGNLPNDSCEEELRQLFQCCAGYRRLSFRTRANGPMCFVEVAAIPNIV